MDTAVLVQSGLTAPILLPLIGALLAFVMRRWATPIGLLSVVALLGSVILQVPSLFADGPQRLAVGGWGAPLGVDLYADGLSVAMLLMTAVVGLGISLYAAAYFRDTPARTQAFWPLWLLLLTALNALFLSADIFNLYVTLEILGLSAVALTAIVGGADALVGAMRYLLVSLLGSLAYLLGVALLYHAYGTVDIALLAERIAAEPATWAAMGLMSAGLMLKTALFPLHFWLPPAHASAAAPVSAALSALVVKGSFYLLVRFWVELFGEIAGGVATLLGLLGAAAVLWGSIQALIQTRLKLLIAYSTVAQIGYLFLAFPLAVGTGIMAWSGVLYLALSHALAKAAMFLVAGNLLRFGGHDRIADLDRVVQRLPLSMAAFALAGVSIVGLPPSGGFIGKWLLLQSALTEGRWGWAIVIVLGGVMAAAYVFKVVGHAFTESENPHQAQPVPATMEWVAFALAAAAVLMGLIVSQPLGLLEIGNPFGIQTEGAAP
ncbi:complex I subunit 5 family protein [Thiocapsa rosea]|uniref:Multisubunit sodium/proton antiporter MrpD subunit n=1 Tax=Thiocapsa rosea TaxID=69360 RepID=A0A495V519_9GAMM|nr:proton-conducting transporter membrane subunit [Thiocapsa rosea]RKT43703.1 multisubunit sodium/proton antiporter MrpD subunit [Thiocapsa rosea]